MASSTSAALAREREAEEYVPYIGHITPEVMLMTDDRVMGMFHLAGVPFETADEAELNALHQQLNLLLRNIASDRLVLYLHLVRGHDAYYPGGTFRSAFARELDAQYRRRMLGRDRFRNDLYLSVIRGTPRHAAEGLTKLFRKVRPAGEEEWGEAAQGLEDIMATLKAGLAPYGPHRLGLRTDKRVSFSEIGEALRRMMFGEWLPVPLVAGSLGAALYSERVIFGREAIEIRGPGHQQFGAVFGIKEYPGHTYPGQFDAVLGAPYRCVLTQSFGFLGKAAAQAILTRKQNQMVSAQDKAASQMDELTEAADQLQSNLFAMGEHHLAMMILTDRLRDLPDRAAQARRDLAESGAVIVREDLALEAGYWSQLPGNLRWRVRPAAVTSRNFAAMAAMHDYRRQR
jgi:type IV secretion system protein VirB4